MNSLITKTISAPPAPIDRGLDTLVRRIGGQLERPTNPAHPCSILSQFAPTEADREAIKRRGIAIADSLSPCDPDVLVQIVAGVRAMMPGQSGGDPKIVMQLYVDALHRFPEWAIRQVCREFLEGRAGGSDTFAPTSAAIAVRCEVLVGPLRVERHELRQILGAEVYKLPDDQTREEIGRRFDALLAEFKGRQVQPSNTDNDRARKEREARILEAEDRRAAGLPPDTPTERVLMPLSDAALRACGVEPVRQEDAA